jgi:menaquinone-dependent protoporphyrinogen IX oxidase
MNTSDNKKTVVIYRSKTGFTKNYAQWIAEELGCDLYKGEDIKVSELQNYDTIIYGAGLYASGISGIKLITDNFDLLKNKNLFVFSVGASPVREVTTAELRKANFKGEQFEKIHFYYLRGGFDYSRLSPFYRFLMTLRKIQLKNSKSDDPDVKGMLNSYEHPLDFTKKKNVESIVNDILSCLGLPLKRLEA